MAEDEAMKTPSHWWWFDRDYCSIHQNRSPWLQSEIDEVNEKTKAILEVIEADAESFSQRADVYFEKRPQLINLVEDLYRSYSSLAVRFDHLKSHCSLSISDDQLEYYSDELEYTQVQVQVEVEVEEEESNFNNQNDELILKLREEIERMKEEKKEQLMYKEKEKREVINQLNMARKEEKDHELMKLREEMEQLMYKQKENKQVITQLNMAIQLFQKEEEQEKYELKEEIQRQKEQLMQKDQEKKEVIRQLSMGMDLLREENVHLRKVAHFAITGGYSKSCWPGKPIR